MSKSNDNKELPREDRLVRVSGAMLKVLKTEFDEGKLNGTEIKVRQAIDDLEYVSDTLKAFADAFIAWRESCRAAGVENEGLLLFMEKVALYPLPGDPSIKEQYESLAAALGYDS